MGDHVVGDRVVSMPVPTLTFGDLVMLALILMGAGCFVRKAHTSRPKK